MKQVIVVGAGATVAEAGRPKRSEIPPLDATFFELCTFAKLSGRPKVRNYVVNRFGVDPFAGGFGMEEIFNLIYTDSLSNPPPTGCLEAYWLLLKLYANAIGHTTNRLKGTSRSGVGKMLRHFYLDDTDQELSFVTFNQDLVIEKAIDFAKKTKQYSHVPWSLGDCYGVSFADIYPFTTHTQFRNVVGEKSIKIHKLHGSLNWLYNVRSNSDPMNSIRKPKGSIHCLNSHDVVHNLQFSSGRGRSINVIPLIVPPIHEKSQYSQNLSPIWTHAANDISSCDSLIFFGYSLPAADAWARTLLRAAIYSNPKLTDVSIIDPSSVSASRVREVIGARSLHHYADMDAFLRN